MAAVVGAVVLGGLALVLVWVLRESARSLPVAANSVAVLPFDNLSSDPEQEYFADGITVEVLNALSRVRGLQVTGRASSFHFEGRNEDLRSLGEALAVEYVLEGSVRRNADQVRISAQLSNARTGVHLWSKTYERRLDDLFWIQDESATAVAGALEIKLGVGDLGCVPGMARNVAAYDEYLRGMSLNLDWRPESYPLAITHLQRAVALDPSFSPAWAGLNTAYTNGALLMPGRAEEWLSSASDALDHARALTPDAPHVLLEFGIGETRQGRWREAAAIYERLQTSYTKYGMADQAWGPRGVFLLGVGRSRCSNQPQVSAVQGGACGRSGGNPPPRPSGEPRGERRTGPVGGLLPRAGVVARVVGRDCANHGGIRAHCGNPCFGMCESCRHLRISCGSRDWWSTGALTAGPISVGPSPV